MAFEEFIPKQKYKCFEFLQMLKRLFPVGPIWNFKITNCADSIEKVSQPPAPLLSTVNVDFSRALNNKIYIGVNGSPAKLYEWDGASAQYDLVAQNDLGQTNIYGLEYYDNKIFCGTGNGGKLLSFTPGGSVFVQEAPQLNSQTDLFFLEVWSGILYIGTHNGGRLFKYDSASPGAMTQVLPQLSGEQAIHYIRIFNSKLYGSTAWGAKLFEWDGVAGVWSEVASTPSGANQIYAMEIFNNELYAGSSPNTGFYKWDGSGAWLTIPLPDEIPTDTSLHFLRAYGNALYGATIGEPYIFKYEDGVATVIARPADFDNPGVGIFGLNVLNGNLYAVHGDGNIYQIRQADERTSLLGLLMSCFSRELHRFASQFNLLLRESVPGLSTEAELLVDWERIAGLPDSCSSLGTTEAQRQLTVHQKIYGLYTGLSKQFFIDYAAGSGVTITIVEDAGGDVFRTTHKSSGVIQRVTQMPTGDVDGSRLNSLASIHTWTVTIVSDPNNNQDVLECIFNKLKPAHTIVVFIKLP
jgi:uncharacterized protein YmfQ (DUF2313 family)